MALYKRDKHYYVNKTICGRQFRFSLKTSDRSFAKELYELWLKETLTAMIRQKAILADNARRDFQPFMPALGDPKQPRPLLKDAFNEFLQSFTKNPISKAHLKHREKMKAILIQQNYQWPDITPKAMDELQHKIKADYAPHTAFKLIGGLISFLRFAVKRGYYSQNDYAILDFMKAPKSKKRRFIFTDDEIESIIHYCKGRGDFDFLYFILTLYFTASRPSEIVNLSHKDIDFKNERVSVWMSKTQKYKTVSLPRFFLDELMNLVKFNERTDAYLFLGQGRQKEFYSKKFKALREALNLNPEYNLYLFRHTAGTKALGMSQNIHLVKELLGHDNIKTTSKYYMLDNPEHTRPAIDKLIEGVYGKRKNEISGIIGILPKIQIAFPALIFSLFCITI